MSMLEVLTKINIKVEKEVIDEEDIMYFCDIPVDESKEILRKVIVIENNKDDIKLIRNYPIEVKKNDKIYELINEINNELLYGSVYLAEKKNIIYDISTFLPKDTNLKYKIIVFEEYINYYVYKINEIIKKLRENDILIE